MNLFPTQYLEKTATRSISSIYVLKQQKRAERSETKALLLNAYPKGRQNRISIVHKWGGAFGFLALDLT